MFVVYVLFVALLFYMSQTLFFADSEIWSVTLSHKWPGAEKHPSLFYKSLFHGSLHALTTNLRDDIQILQASRLFYTVIAVLKSFFIVYIAKTIRPNLRAHLVLFLIMSFSFFVLRGVRIRSDLLAECFFLFAMCSVFYRLARDRGLQVSSILLEGFALSAALAATPKSIYFVITYFIVNIVAFSRKIETTRLVLFIGGVLSLAGLALVGIYLSQPDLFGAAYSRAASFYTNSFAESPGVPSYFSLAAFTHVGNLAIQNPHLILLTCALFFVRNFTEKLTRLPLLAWLLCSTLIVILHNDRLPFFILSQSAILLLCATLALDQFAPKLRRTANKSEDNICSSS